MNSSKSLSPIRFAILAMIVGLSSPAFAQFGASLSGTVQDSTGAAIPGATVVLLNITTQITAPLRPTPTFQATKRHRRLRACSFPTSHRRIQMFFARAQSIVFTV
jgi:hypothetical protein